MTRWDAVSEAGGRFLERAAERSISRAQFVKRSAVAAVAGLGLLRAGRALGASASGFDPNPIPGGFDENFNIVPSGAFIHVLPPTVGFEMATITDFQGVIAAAEIQGTAQGTDGTEYTFDTDMRFMKGRYVGMDGRQYQGAFGFIWIDLFAGAVGDPSAQVHDFEPGIKPSGLFWTIPVPSSAGVVDPSTGAARFRMQNVAVPDFHDFFNAISPFPSTLPAHVSFDVRWSGGGETASIRDPVFGFEGDYVGGDATIMFRAYDDTRRGVIFTSNPGQSTVGVGVGRERNGVYFT